MNKCIRQDMYLKKGKNTYAVESIEEHFVKLVKVIWDERGVAYRTNKSIFIRTKDLDTFKTL